MYIISGMVIRFASASIMLKSADYARLGWHADLERAETLLKIPIYVR